MKPSFQDRMCCYVFFVIALLRMQHLAIYHDPGMTFQSSDVDIHGCGAWVFIAPSHPNNTASINIWHTSQPLLRLSNSHTSRILDMVENELYKWLDPYSMEPLAVPKFYQLVRQYLVISRAYTNHQNSHRIMSWFTDEDVQRRPWRVKPSK